MGETAEQAGLPRRRTDGRGICYLEFGDGRVAKVDMTFRPGGQASVGQFDEASEVLAVDKAEFGSSRIRRWFDRVWSAP